MTSIRNLALAAPSALAALIVFVACGPSTPGAASPDAPKVQEKNLTAGDGVELETGCTPSGPELCFNAIDDNCNGVIDEGCGVLTGVLQFTIAWGDSPADVDLIVTDPDGERVDETNRGSKSGLRLDRDCPGEGGCHGQNIENIFMEGLDVPRGKYVVEVKLVDAKSAKLPVKVRVSARVGNHTFGSTVTLAPGGAESKKNFSFEL
jgi:tRNA (guanosine-2'-O-)-methyltransferase